MRTNTGPVYAPCLHMSILECAPIQDRYVLLVHTCPFRSAHNYWTCACYLFTHVHFGVRNSTGPVHATCLYMSILECAQLLNLCMLLVYTCPFWSAQQCWSCACSLFTHVHSGMSINTGPMDAPYFYTCPFWSAHQY